MFFTKFPFQEFFFFTDDLDERRLKRGPSSEGGGMVTDLLISMPILAVCHTVYAVYGIQCMP